MIIKNLILFFFNSLLIVSVSFSGEFLTLQVVRKSVESAHSLVKASGSKRDSAESFAIYADQRPNPKLEIGYFIEPVETRVGAMKSKVGISQALPAKSRLNLKKRVQLENVEIAQLEKERLVQELKLQATLKFFEYLYLHQKLRILEDNLKIVQSWSKLWETHYSHHDFRYQRLVQLQIEATQIQDKIREVSESIPNTFQELANLSWLEQSQAIPPSFDSKVKKDQLSFDPSSNIELLILDVEQKKQRLKVSLERSFFIPSKTLRTDWTMIDSRNGTGGEDAWMIGLGMEILLNKSETKSRVEGQERLLEALNSKREYLLSNLESDFLSLQFQSHNSMKKLELYRDDLIPRTKESLDSLQINYSSQNKGMDFFGLLDTLRKLLSLNLELEAIKKNYFQARARQYRLLGKEVPW